MAQNIVQKEIQNNLFKEVQINGRTHFDHRVFGLVDEKWLRDHGVKPTDSGVPCVMMPHPTKGEILVIDPKFAEAEKRYSQLSRMSVEERNKIAAAEKELVAEAQRIFN